MSAADAINPEATVLPIDKDRRRLRACLLCGLIKSASQFRSHGCENCDAVLNMKDRPKRVNECTSATFDGIIAQMRPEASWVSRWQRTDKFVKGMYAIRVSGRLSAELEERLLDRGIKYRPRDGSVRD
ncbi:transcription elongation factor spt4 [Gaertneriomyces sp. JEL0708]|nr:transcription elongation factor spt4 [Gaertneriomyces sp. JEL0708]